MPKNHRNPFHPGERVKEMEEKETIAERDSKEKLTQQPNRDEDDPLLRPQHPPGPNESRDENQPKAKKPQK